MTDRSSNTKNAASRPSNRRRMATVLAASLATMAFVVPSAMARPAGPAAGAAFAQQSHQPSSISTGATNASADDSSSSDLGYAGIGVGAVLVTAALAGLAIQPRRRGSVGAQSATSAC